VTNAAGGGGSAVSSGSVTSLDGGQQQTGITATTVKNIAGDSSVATSIGGTGSTSGSQPGVPAGSGKF
jgi:hypothetical protein